MSLTDFLFQGSAPPSVTTYGSTSSSMPPWFESYQQALLGKSNVIAGEPYQPYTTTPGSDAFNAVANQRVAQINPYTKYGWSLGQDAATSYMPTLNKAINGPTAGDASSPWINKAMAEPGAAASASPYLQQGALSWPSQAQSYMNPFTDQVANRLTDLSNRNLTENVLPGVSDNFVKSGMFGASRQGEFTNRAVRDQNESLMGALSNAYSGAYNQGAQQFGADASRQLQAGQTLGSLQSQDTQNMLNAGNLSGNFANVDRTTTGALARQQQQQGLTGASIYEAIGQQAQQQDQANIDANYQNFLEQRNYPKDQAGFMNNMIRGLPSPTSTSTSGSAPSNNYNAPPFAQLLGAATGISGLLGGYKAKRGGRISTGYLSGGRVQRKRSTRHGALSYAEGGQEGDGKEMTDEDARHRLSMMLSQNEHRRRMEGYSKGWYDQPPETYDFDKRVKVSPFIRVYP